jgi:flagellar biosynthetic protein FliP
MTRLILLVLLALAPCAAALADAGLAAVTVTTAPDGGKTYSLSLQILALLTAMSLLPAGLMMMTSFTRIIIVLAILRQALGTASTPTTQTLIGLALFLTIFIMMPVFTDVYDNAVQPYTEEKMTMKEALDRGSVPIKKFMLEQTRDSDLSLFAGISGSPGVESREQVPFSLLMPAFLTSELKTAFQIGFIIFIPFLIIDLVVASVLMSMGMMMLSPLIISLPFKIMLFVLVDGWALILGTLAASFST